MRHNPAMTPQAFQKATGCSDQALERLAIYRLPVSL
jgi:hypothetical protein